MTRARAIALLTLLVLLGLPAPRPAAAEPSPDDQTRTPIKHFIVLMQENHSFDNYFGTYPDADGLPPDTCMPVNPVDPANTECVRPFHIGHTQVVDLSHNIQTWKRQYHDGRMDGFIAAFREEGRDGTLTMGYYDGTDLPFHWNVADQYVLFDRFFSSAAGGSVKNHMYWVTAAPGNDEDAIPKGGWNDLPTIFDRLQERGISWKFYVENYDPTITYRSDLTGDRGAQPVWVPLLAYARYIDDPNLFSHIVNLDEYYHDLQSGTLPAVSYIVPSGASEHPPGSLEAGQRFIRSLVTALMSSSAWDTSAFLWTYDDWGGWFDHVKPPQVDEHGYGFRVPALLVSAYARKGYVDSTVLDYTSILKFIEENWGIPPLTQRDARANNFLSAFDFASAPRPPSLIPYDRQIETTKEPRRVVIPIAYSAALGIAGLVAAVGLGQQLRRRSTRLSPGARATERWEEGVP